MNPIINLIHNNLEETLITPQTQQTLNRINYFYQREKEDRIICELNNIIHLKEKEIERIRKNPKSLDELIIKEHYLQELKHKGQELKNILRKIRN